jgi:hypothetical protein
MSKLLIVGGCSNTDPNWPSYRSNNITMWPELISKELGIEVLNTSKVGSSNDRICNMIMDAVIDNQDRDLLVMILWSSHNRLNIFDEDYFVKPTTKASSLTLYGYNQYKLVEYTTEYMREEYTYDKHKIFDIDKDVLNYNLRAIWKLNNFLKERNIEFYQVQAFSLVNHIIWMGPFFEDEKLSFKEKEFQKEREAKLIEYAPTNRYFDESYFTTQHWRNNSLFLEDSSMVIGKDDYHPNQIGQEWLANTFMLLSESKFTPQSLCDRTSIVDFVYD